MIAVTLSLDLSPAGGVSHLGAGSACPAACGVATLPPGDHHGIKDLVMKLLSMLNPSVVRKPKSELETLPNYQVFSKEQRWCAAEPETSVREPESPQTWMLTSGSNC